MTREKGVELTGAIEHQLHQHHALWRKDQGHPHTGQGFPRLPHGPSQGQPHYMQGTSRAPLLLEQGSQGEPSKCRHLAAFTLNSACLPGNVHCSENANSAHVYVSVSAHHMAQTMLNSCQSKQMRTPSWLCTESVQNLGVSGEKQRTPTSFSKTKLLTNVSTKRPTAISVLSVGSVEAMADCRFARCEERNKQESGPC